MIKKIFSSELGKGAIILFASINFFNFLNLVFHFSMARMLGPEGYGTLAVLMALIYIFGVPAEAIQNLVSRYTSRFNLSKDYGKIKFFIKKSICKGFGIAKVIFVIMCLASFFIAKFLEINLWLILTTNLLIFFILLSPIARGVLQGRKKFSLLGSSMIIEAGLKLFFAISFVLFGLKVFGAIGGILLGLLAGLIFSLYFNKDILSKKENDSNLKGIYKTSIPYFITLLVVILMFSLDIILAKRFFPSEIAGQYAVLSMLGKIIFLGTIAISKTMFPLTSEKKDRNEDSSNIFKKSFAIVFSLCFVAVILYLIFPKLIVDILYGSQYLGIAPYLVYSGITMSFLSLGNLVLIYGLSVNRLKKPFYLFAFLGVEIILLSLFHSNLLEYVISFMVSSIIMFIGALFFVKK